MKRFLLLFLILLAACSKDPLDIAKESPKVQDFLSRHPNAGVTVGDLTRDQSAVLINEIRIACGSNMEPDYYKRIVFNESESYMIVYVTDTIECIYTLGDSRPEEEVIDTTPTLPDIQDVKITGLERSEKQITLAALITDDNIVDAFRLSFVAECQDWKVQPLQIFFNGTLIFDEKPDCGERTDVPISGVTQGTYYIQFRTNTGPYRLTDLQYPGIITNYIELDQEPEQITIFELKSAQLGVPKVFTAPDIDNPVLTFTPNIEGKLKVQLNNATIYDREVLSQPSIKLNNYLKTENTLVFTRSYFDQVCNDVSLEIYLHNNESVLCVIPEESSIQMIFKNNGFADIDKVEIFVKGRGTSVDVINMDLQPGQIFAKVIEHDVGSVSQVILTPVHENTRCRSIVFDNIPRCAN